MISIGMAFRGAHPLPVLGGLDEREKVMLETHPDRVYFLYSLILGQFNARRVVGGLGAEAPVYTRVQHVMSDGMLGFMQARKIEDTPFPFPYAQLLACMLYAFGLLFPLLAASKVGTDPIVQDEDDLEGYGVFVRAVLFAPNTFRPSWPTLGCSCAPARGPVHSSSQ